jgi:hypothetical protein
MRLNPAKQQQTARRNSSDMLKDNTLSILQYNVNKSRDKVMAGLLADERALEYDIIAIQEPWRNPFYHTTYHPVKDRFDLVYKKAEVQEYVFSSTGNYKGHGPIPTTHPTTAQLPYRPPNRRHKNLELYTSIIYTTHHQHQPAH